MTTTIRQCIKTRYVGPTDTKPGRVKATCERGSITIAQIERTLQEAAK